MTSREIIRRVLQFDSPPRIGLTLPEPYENDLLMCGISPAKDFIPPALEPQGNELRRWGDEWGVVRASLTDYDIGEVVEGAITDWSQLDSYRPPDLGAKVRYAEMARDFAAETESCSLYCPSELLAIELLRETSVLRMADTELKSAVWSISSTVS